MLEGLFISSGLAIAGWINLGMSTHSGSVAWRFPMALSVLWSCFILLNTPFMPESPRWLLKKARVADAKSVLADLNDVDADSQQVSEAVAAIEASLELAGQAKFKDIFKNFSTACAWHALASLRSR